MVMIYYIIVLQLYQGDECKFDTNGAPYTTITVVIGKIIHGVIEFERSYHSGRLMIGSSIYA